MQNATYDATCGGASTLDAGPFIPHGYCPYWQADVAHMHLVSDIAIALAYVSIPLSILYLLRKRKQGLPHRWVFVFFAVFIFLCGTGHLIALVTLWYPIYYVQGYVKAATAAASLATALLIYPLMPELIERLRGPHNPRGAASADVVGH